MDPYRTLGVPRGCSRDDVKAAFRARVPLAHPDHGGDEFTFIQLRAAYEQILRDLDRRRPPRVDTNRPAPTPWHDSTSEPRDPTESQEQAAHDEPPVYRHAPTPHDPVVAREAYIDLVQRVSARASHGRHRKLRKLARTLGTISLLYFMLFVPITGLFYVTVTVLELEKDARLSGWRTESLINSFWVAVNVASFLPACWLVWKYGSS
jgi:DnaJ domain